MVDKGKNMTDQLEDFLNEDSGEEAGEEATGDVAEEVETETEEAPENETVVENEEAPTAPKEEPKREDDKPETMPMSAFMGQKQELKEAKARIAELQHKSEPKEEIDVFEEPEKFKENVLSDAKQIALNSRFETSEMIMQDKHGDYDEKADKFEALVKTDPSLYNQLVTSKNPAKFIYDHVVKTEKMNQFDNIEDHEANIRAEERAKVMAEIEAANKGEPAKAPPSMVGVRSNAAPKADDQVDTLDSILNG